NVNGTLFFQANDGTHGLQLWESNGSAAGTLLVKDINGTSNSGPYFPANVNGTLFFAAFDGTLGAELWESNGTSAGTFLVTDLNPGTNGSYPHFLTNVNGNLFFTATDGTTRSDPWVVRPASNTAVSSSASLSAFGQIVTFTATVTSG